VVAVKSEELQAKRIAQAIDALLKHQNFVAFMQVLKINSKS
jgi:hypothetical protein